MKTLQKQYDKDKGQAGASPDHTSEHRTTLYISNVEALIRPWFSVSDQTEQGRDRGDGDER